MDDFLSRSVSYVESGKPPFPTTMMDSHFFMGSCFAENLYSYMNERFFDCRFSPFGNIYNPLSLASSIKRLCEDEPIASGEVFENNGLWRHFSFDTGLCRTNREDFLSSINKAVDEGRKMVRRCTRLYLTLGTSYVFRHIDSGEVVNNCHKLPSARFTRHCASIDEMKESLSAAFDRLLSLNKKLKIVMTLSPVRHLRDDPAQNSLSKARLRCLIEELSPKYGFWYFPSYEIMLDQLRDYRWYDWDLAHPSAQATDYIMERFFRASADTSTVEFLDDMNRLRNRLNHRILHPGTKEAANFRLSTGKMIENLISQYPENNRLKEIIR